MRFERLTAPGPKGGIAAFSAAETPEQLGAAFVYSRIRIELQPGAKDLRDDCGIAITASPMFREMRKVDIRSEVEKGNPKRLKSIKLVPNSGALLYFASDSEQYVGLKDRIQDNGANGNDLNVKHITMDAI